MITKNLKLGLRIDELEKQNRELTHNNTMNLYESFSRLVSKKQENQRILTEENLVISSKESSIDLDSDEILNKELMNNCILQDGGLLYSDDCIEVISSIYVNRRECQLGLELWNKTDEVLSLSLIHI